MNCPQCGCENITPAYNHEIEQHGLWCLDCDWSVNLDEIAEALELQRRLARLGEMTYKANLTSEGDSWYVVEHTYDDFGEFAKANILGSSLTSALQALRNTGISDEPATEDGV
jgi:hypothetical protein